MSATRATVMFIAGNPFLVVSNMAGTNTYMRVTCAMSAEEMRDLATRLNIAAGVMEATTPADLTRPACAVCLRDTVECVCAIRARAKLDAESKLCVTCKVWTRLCCKLHREPVRS